MPPFLSVIVPVRNGADTLGECLSALHDSDLPRDCWELIVVDDASDDGSAATAARTADLVIRLPDRPRGPAYGRNRGLEIAHGDNIVFIDADVRVHRDTLRRFRDVLENEPEVCGVSGSFDDHPPCRTIVSQYWNLLHHYHARQNAGDVGLFSASCGAVRRAALAQAGPFDEWHFSEPQVEDVELGQRLRDQGFRVVLRPEIQSTPLKQWTVGALLRDVWGRGTMLSRLLDYSSQPLVRRHCDLVKTLAGASCVVTGLFAIGMLASTPFGFDRWSAAFLVALVGATIVNRSVHAFFLSRRGIVFTAVVVPLHVLAGLVSALALLHGWLLRHLLGEPHPDPTTQAFAEIGVQSWPPVPRRN